MKYGHREEGVRREELGIFRESISLKFNPIFDIMEKKIAKSNFSECINNNVNFRTGCERFRR